MSRQIPDGDRTPGEVILAELESRGWTQTDLAEILGRPARLVNEIISGKRSITPETARGLADAFGIEPTTWMSLDAAYRLAQTKPEDDDVARRARLYSLAPIKEMIRREWIKDANSIASLERELARFFGVPSLDQEPQLTFAPKKSSTYEITTPAQRALAFRAKNLGKAVSAADFDPEAFRQGLASLRHLVTHEADVRRVPRLLAEFGVRLVILEHLSRSRTDGITLWLDEKSPVVAITMRYDRIDHLWFTIAHELSHVNHRDALSVDENLVGEERIPSSEKPESERRADHEAAEFLLPSKEIESFILRIRPLYYRPKIVQFANRIRVHPGIIVGQLQRRGELKYSQHRNFLTKVRDLITQNALTDGWGFAPPVD